jgi:hypothetical protein
VFTYDVNGQPVQVVGQLKNGTGEFFDQATGTNYTFKDGKLVDMRRLDPGRVEATPEPLWTAISLAVGAPELKAGTVAAWQGLKTLFSREALEGLGPITSWPALLPELRHVPKWLNRTSPRAPHSQTRADNPSPALIPVPRPLSSTSHQLAQATASSSNILPVNLTCPGCPTARRRSCPVQGIRSSTWTIRSTT